jgi:SAM-dependent methyltransferase
MSYLNMRRLSKLLNTDQRTILAKRLKTARKLDRKLAEKNWIKHRDLDAYSHFMQIDLNSKILETITTKGSCRLLDVGCGDGLALYQAKGFEKENKIVKTEGLRLFGKRTNEFHLQQEAQTSIDKLRVGSIENYMFRKKYDIILSFGTLQYTANTALAVEKIANALAVGGAAYIQLPKKNVSNQLITNLKKQGFRVFFSVQPTKLSVLQIKRTSKKRANLKTLIDSELRKPLNKNIGFEPVLRR